MLYIIMLYIILLYHIAIKTNPKHYPGSNKLGPLLMELRSENMLVTTAWRVQKDNAVSNKIVPNYDRLVYRYILKKIDTKLFQLLLSRICFAGNLPNANV